jgi:elongation factor G
MARRVAPSRYRNIGILASQDAGRTTTTERLLAVARQGAATGAPVPESSESLLAAGQFRAITLTSAATSCEWRDTRINIVELPAAQRQAADGLVPVLDGLVIVIDGAAGVTPKAELALMTARRSGLPRVVFVNKLDLADADLSAVMVDLTADCPATPILVQMPLGAGLRGLADLVEMRASVWSGASFDSPAEAVSIPESDRAAAEQARKRVVLALNLGDGQTSAAGLRNALRRAVLAGEAAPVLCGSAFRNRGIAALLDAVVDYLPAASEIGRLSAHDAAGLPIVISADDEEAFVAVAFREIAEPGQELLTFVRVYAGTVTAGAEIWNSVAACPERVERILRVRADQIEEISEASAGDIVALVGLKHTNTGDTLCDPNAPVVLERVPMAPIPASAGHAKH